MTSIYDFSNEYINEVGLDYDLCACLDYNPQNGFVVEDIKKVLAVYEGENDERDWRWVLQLKNDKYAFLQGGCDYTGWDCQSWATSVITETPELAAKMALGDFPVEEGQHPMNAGLGHMLNLLIGDYTSDFEKVYISLMNQLNEGKNITWREEHDKLEGLL